MKFMFWPIWRRIPSANGTAHLPTFCPVCRREGPSGNILSSMQIGQNVGRLGKMLADGTSRLQIGQNVARWDGPSANIMFRRQTGWPIWEHFAQYADWTKFRQWSKRSQMGPSHLPMARLQIGQNVDRWDVPSADVPSADWAKCSQMGRCSQMGWNIYTGQANLRCLPHTPRVVQNTATSNTLLPHLLRHLKKNNASHFISGVSQ